MVEKASRRSHKPKNTGSSPVSATNYGAVAQLGERLSCTQEVTSSTLVSSTICFLNSVVRVSVRHTGSRWFKSSRKHRNEVYIIFYADIAQLVECQLAKLKVTGSSPVVRSMRFCACSSDGQSSNLLSCRSGVQLSSSTPDGSVPQSVRERGS